MGVLPFPAVVDQRVLKTALLLNAINRSLGGVLIRGEKGTGKSTTVRGLERVLPTVPAVAGCVFDCHPEDERRQCGSCRASDDHEVEHIETPVVELPLGATEDRVIGSLDIERAISEGVSAFEPGLLARANRGILYVDEVNLLDDHLVDVLLDAAASGVNRVEREGVSVAHPADFILVGTMNPDEGELRPQFLDRFGLQVTAETPTDPEERREIIEITERFDRDPEAVLDRYAEAEAELRQTIESARRRYDDVTLPAELERAVVDVCIDAGIEGHRGDILTARCARTIAAFEGRETVTAGDVRTAASLVLPHRLAAGPAASDAALDSVVAAKLDDGDASGDGEDEPEEPGDDDPPGGEGRVRPAGSRDRRDETNPVVADALDGLRSYLFGEAEDEPEDEPTDQRETVDGAAESATALDPIGAGAPAAETDADALVERLEEPAAAVLARYDESRTRHATRPDADRSGRYVRSRPFRTGGGSDVALDATLRSAAGRGTTDVQRDDLRLKVREREASPIVVFAVDSSASVRAHGHLETVTELMGGLFRESPREPETIAVVAFRDETADLVVPPTGDVRAAARRVADLPTGNKTPLAHGLYAALRLVEAERAAEPESPATLVVLTDGRPTVAVETDPVDEANRVARRVGEADVGFVVVDLDTGRAGSDVCRELARMGDGTYLALRDVPPERYPRRVAEAVWEAGRRAAPRGGVRR